MKRESRVVRLVARAVQEAQTRLSINTPRNLPAAAMVTSGVSVTARTGYPVVDLPDGYQVPPVDGVGPEDTMWVIFFVDYVISVEV